MKQIAGKEMRMLSVCFLMLIMLAGSARAADRAPFEMHFLDVGQGQCTLVIADGEGMLIDGGGRDSSSFVVSYLKDQEIGRLKYLLASHYDEDHIAGLIGAMYSADCDTVLCPCGEASTSIYGSFCKALDNTGVSSVHPQRGDSYQLGGAVIDVLGAADTDDGENESSLCIRITYGEITLLSCGDISRDTEWELMDNAAELSADIYIAGHHGSANSNGCEFLRCVSPSLTVISCGRANTYGHPSENALANIRESGSELYRTDLQGTILICSDGTELWSDQMPCNDWTPGQCEEVQNSGAPAAGAPIGDAESYTYVCNTNTMKFHYPFCSSVKKMKEKNKYYASVTREELIGRGYDPCGNCSP